LIGFFKIPDKKNGIFGKNDIESNLYCQVVLFPEVSEKDYKQYNSPKGYIGDEE